MTTMTKRAHCPVCEKDTLHHIKGLNHILHLLLCIPTFGFWLIVWLLLGIASSISPDIFCAKCGTQTNAFRPADGRKTSEFTWFVLILFFVLVIVGMTMEQINEGERINESYAQRESESEPPPTESEPPPAPTISESKKSKGDALMATIAMANAAENPCDNSLVLKKMPLVGWHIGNDMINWYPLDILFSQPRVVERNLNLMGYDRITLNNLNRRFGQC